MTGLDACPVCGTARPANRAGGGPWCCSIACYRAYHRVDQRGASPGGDGVTTTCTGCQRPFSPAGRQRFCCEACRVAVHRRYREADQVPVVAPRGQRRQPVAVYACGGCGARAVGERRCDECRTSMRRVGLGGCCPCCDEPVAVDELLGREVIA